MIDRIRSFLLGFGLKSRIGSGSKISVNRKGKLKINGPFSMRTNCHISVSSKAVLNVGSNLFCNHNVLIACREHIVIGNNVLLGPNVVIVDHNHDYHKKDRSFNFVTKEITIMDNVWIGSNCTILPGAFISEGAVIAANSVVKGFVPPLTIFAGNPAKKVKQFELEQ